MQNTIVLGIAGQALTGKTAVANELAPMGRMTDPQNSPIVWDHLFFALPLYRIATARQKITGDMAMDRMSYEIHDGLVEIFGGSPLFGAPSYNVLTSMVREVLLLHCEPEGEKPRSFLQNLGDHCRNYDPDCFVKWMKTRVNLILNAEQDEDDESPIGVVVSDVRFPNEAEFIANHPRGLLVKYVADERVRQSRSLERDGKLLRKTESGHHSENYLDSIPEDLFDAVIDTSDITLDEQVRITSGLAEKAIGLINAQD